MNSQQLLYLTLIIGALIVLYIIFGRSKTRQPVRLRTKEEPKAEASAEVVAASATEETPSPQVTATSEILEPEVIPEQKTEEKPEPVPEAIPVQSRNLKIYFAFNGHDWEAYEALGVPVNAPITTVTRMYQHLIKTSDPSTFDFFESAYTAIIKKRKDQK